MPEYKERQEITDALEAFGLNDKELKAYTTLLELGQSTAYAVSHASNLKLSTTYVILDSLIVKGVVIRVPQTRKRLYAARLPDTLLDSLKNKIKIFERAVPLLSGMINDKGKRARMSFFEGVSGVKQGLWHRSKEIRNGEILSFYGVAQNVNSELNDVFMEYYSTMIPEKIKTRAIAPEHSSLKKYRDLDEKHGRIVKIVPYEKYSSNMSIDVTPIFVRIIIFSVVPQCVVIEGAEVSQTFKQIFEMLWGFLPNDQKLGV